MTEQIINYVIALIPSIVAIVTALSTAIGILKQFGDLREDVNNKVDVKELQEKLEIAISENRELEQIIKREIETRTHIKED